MRRSYFQVFILLLLSLAAGSVAAVAQGFRDATFNGHITRGQGQGYVSALQSNGMLLVGGNYLDSNGERKPYLTRVNSTNGTIDAAFNSGGTGPNGTVYAILPLPDGKIMIGGSFTTYNGVAANRIIRLNADGTRDTSFTGTGSGAGIVTTMVRQSDGKVVVAGQSLANYNGVTAWGWFRVNTDGSRDTTFVSQFSAAPGIDQIALQPDGKLIMVGGFTGYQGQSVMGVLRANSDGTIDTTFNTGGAGTDGWVSSVALQPDGDVLIGGAFSTFNGVSTGPFVRLLSNGVIDGGFVPPALSTATSYVESIAVQSNGNIVAGGAFHYSNGSMAPVIRVNTFGSLDTSFNPGRSDNLAYDIQVSGSDEIYMTGWFTHVGNADRAGVAKFTAAGTLVAGFTPTIDIQGRLMGVFPLSDGKVIVAGNFQAANGQTYKDVARLNADGTVDTTFVSALGTGANNYRYSRNVLAAELQPDGKILIGGDFGGFRGSNVGGLVRLNADGSLDTSFEMDANQFDYMRDVWVYDIAVTPDGKILCAGLSFAPGAASPNIVWRLNSNGSLDTTFDRKVGNSQALGITLTSDGKYMLTGNFTLYDGTTSQRIVKLNTNGSKDATFTGAANNLITNALEQPDGKFIVYGSFTTLQGGNRVRIGRLNANGSLDTTFQASAAGGGADNTVRSMIRLNNGNLLVGGSFTAYGGATANKLMILSPDGALITNFTSGFDAVDTVHALGKQADGKVIVGGTFDAYSGVAAKSVVRLTGPSINGSGTASTYFDYDGDGKADVSIFRPSDGSWHMWRSGTNQYHGNFFGSSGDAISPADFDGDGKTDLAVFRHDPTDPDRSMFYILNSETNTMDTRQFGREGDDPSVVGDWDGDGKADIAVYRAGATGSASYFFYRPSGDASVNFRVVPWGIGGDLPVRGDFDGDGQIDATIYRPSTGIWWINGSSIGATARNWGLANDKLVPADYDGDGKTDLAVYRNGVWLILQSTSGQPRYETFGLASDTPVPADYDGDRKADVAVYRSGSWYINRSQDGFYAMNFGNSTDIPTPSAPLP